MTVTTEDLRRLLGSGTRAELVLTEGRVEIREQEDDPDAGMAVISRAALLEQLGESADEVGDDQLRTAASALDDVIAKLGA